jgi:hypothetical protein
MKANHWSIQALVVSAALAIGMAAPASAGINDPEVIIYRYPGVYDNNAPGGVGIATVFMCTNFSGATEVIRFVTRDNFGSIASNKSVAVEHVRTKTASTHVSFSFTFNDLDLATGQVTQGTTAIAATSINVVCTAMIVDAANAKPSGVALHGIRLNPIPGSQE